MTTMTFTMLGYRRMLGASLMVILFSPLAAHITILHGWPLWMAVAGGIGMALSGIVLWWGVRRHTEIVPLGAPSWWLVAGTLVRDVLAGTGLLWWASVLGLSGYL